MFMSRLVNIYQLSHFHDITLIVTYLTAISQLRKLFSSVEW